MRVSPEVRLRNRFGQFISEIELGVDSALDEIETVMTVFIKQEAPVVRGVLKARSKGVRVGRSVVGVSNVYYADYVLDGTPPHDIGEEGQGLRNPSPKSKGRDPKGFGAIGPVLHPGNRPNDFLGRAYARVWPMSLAILDKHVD